MAFNLKQTISFLLVTLILASIASSLSHDEECSSLLQFKQTFDDQPSASFDVGEFGKFASWRKIPRNASNHDDSQISECCFWDGVVCSEKGDHVIGLDLSQSSLQGPINSNSSLFNLVHLQTLNLSMNDFVESEIPSRIARLKQLRILDLSDSRFSGHVPIEISQLVQLSSLNLGWNPLKLGSLEYLLQNMTRLEEVVLSGIDVSSSVPRFLANFSSLRLINLGNCQLQDEFPSAIFQLPKLNILVLRNNTKLVGSLPEFHNNTMLTHLNLFATGFGGTIPESIGKLSHLEYLRLSQCSFTGRVPSSLSNLTQLTALDLGSNSFEKGRLFDWLSKLTKLNQLSIARMSIYEEIPPSIANLTQLTFVDMSVNYIFGQIPSSFTNLSTLTTLDLSENQLQGPISTSFSNFKSLVFLGLSANNFSGTVEEETFLGLDKLEILSLSQNRISFVATKNYTNASLPNLNWLGLESCNLKEFPTFLRSQNKITALNLYDNKIEGLVPTWIWNNSQETLQAIDLSFNFITGFDQDPHFLPWLNLDSFSFWHNQLQGPPPIPPQTTTLYDVSLNNLTGEIPPSICQIRSLRYLDFFSNHMTGALPSCLSNLSNSLLILNLNRNNFHGPMMDSFTKGCSLKSIDLSENQFTGEVPKSLANCTGLQILSLGDNSLHGLFPFWLGNLADLEILLLRSNKFYGEIQGLSTLSSQFQKLRILDLSSNSFRGQLPDKYWNAMKYTYLGNSSNMGFLMSFGSNINIQLAYSMTLTNKGVIRDFWKILNIFIAIDFSGNNFVGEIPQSLQDLQGLQSLNLSNNHLTGNILASLGNLKNLESLDLSRNELWGEIPQELLQLGFLAILNVSFNLLHGKIPQGKQFNTFDNSSYVGNPRLCGQPLSNDCESSKAATPPQAISEDESLLPSVKSDWIVMFSGVVSGLLVGIVIGNMVNARYGDWFVEKSGLRKDKWAGPLRNKMRK